MWRLPMDGVPLAGNSHISVGVEACGCGTFGGAHGAPCSLRAHHFWECAVAQAVREQIDNALPASITRRQLWCGMWLCWPPYQLWSMPGDGLGQELEWRSSKAESITRLKRTLLPQ